MQMHGAKPLTVPLQQARLRPALPLSSPKTPMSPVVGSSWLLRAISSSDVPPDRPSRQGLSSSVIMETRRLAALPYCTGTSRETSPYNMPRGEQTKRHESRALFLAPGCLGRNRATARRKAPGFLCARFWGIPRWSVFRACSSPSSPRVPPVRRRHSPQPNQQQQQHKSTQHTTTQPTPRERERETKKKAGGLRRYLRVRTAQHSTARCGSPRTPALLVTRKVRPARWRGREGTGEALSSVFRRNKPCEENICIHRINSAVL